MSILLNLYQKKLADNEKNLQFWTDYLGNLIKLDLEQFSKKLKVPILVPIGNSILFRGELKHTNEVTVALGSEYFVKCSIKQAEILRQHRIQDCKTKVEALKGEKEFLESQMTFSSENILESSHKEIIEIHTEEEENKWREDHRKKVKFYKQNQSKVENNNADEITDEALWRKLEELELQEELQNEILLIKDNGRSDSCLDTQPSFDAKEDETIFLKPTQCDITRNKALNINNDENISVTKDPSTIEILQKVIDKQNELEIKLTELKNQERRPTKTEEDLVKRLDNLEALDELEDEMNRLEDILEDDVEEIENDEAKRSKTKIKRYVTFADEDDTETLEITFKHSSVEPTDELYNADVGVTKPSDIYQAFHNSFKDTTSILKKVDKVADENIKYGTEKNNDRSLLAKEISEESKRTILIKDVIENNEMPHIGLDSKDNKRVSLFKQRRLKKS